ncbi:hypothetical protein U879_02855 [Defluviimonas sp. 20V17]|uniref:DUF1499 domain-containing protein n=1 Tax=Allgaiera indica TaxID=765699 RepID=A0AAN5A0V6_9RHOB|nr:DUF1499 domain-containing protein [Allgaiera indica]KDB05203.1 hypothetical protein U879_02855 [Defluviimonas sp. 20V17]GHE05326.1 hypothetical protein GCM10008024_35670 [Allgaiera indica]SDX63372.1 Protein of unknown function [Allgaiera indica]
MIRWALGLILLAAALAALWVRLAPNPATDWAVNPLVAGHPGMENGYLIRPENGDQAAPIYPVSAPDLARRIDAIARSWPRTRLLAGSPAQGEMTYITRSRIWGFPDFTSIKVLPEGTNSTFAAFARARFGKSDFGVNRTRLKAWLNALATP